MVILACTGLEHPSMILEIHVISCAKEVRCMLKRVIISVRMVSVSDDKEVSLPEVVQPPEGWHQPLGG